MKPIVAAQLYTVRKQCQTPDEIGVALKKVADIGYTAVQISSLGDIDDQQLRDLCDANGLVICATHVRPVEALTEDIESVIRQHKTYGCSYVGLGGMPTQYRDSAEGFSAFARWISPIADRLKEEGLQFIYHNHAFEFQRFDGRLGMDILFEECSQNVHFELDTHWVQAGGASPALWIRKADGRMKVVHFKDTICVKNAEGKYAPYYTHVGSGNQNWPEILKACEAIGVVYAAVELDDTDIDPFDSLALSYRYLTTLGWA